MLSFLDLVELIDCKFESITSTSIKERWLDELKKLKIITISVSNRMEYFLFYLNKKK